VKGFCGYPERPALPSSRWFGCSGLTAEANIDSLKRGSATPISETAQKNHDEPFPGHVSALKVIEVFDNFAFDEVLAHSSLDTRCFCSVAGLGAVVGGLARCVMVLKRGHFVAGEAHGRYLAGRSSCSPGRSG